VRTKKSRIVKALMPRGEVCYYSSIGACCREHGIRYEDRLITLVNEGGIAPDGRTFFDWPTEEEERLIAEGIIKFRDENTRKRI